MSPHAERNAPAEPPLTDKETTDQQERPAIEREQSVVPRARLLTLIFLAIILVFVARLVKWRISEGASPTTAPAAQTQAEDRSRGRIVDSNGVLLATDILEYEIYADPRNFRESKRREELTSSVAALIGMSVEELQNALSGDVPAVQLSRTANALQCDAIVDLKAPMILWCDHRHARVYPQGSLGAHAIGATSYDQEGVAGVEGSYDAWLRAAKPWPANRLPDQFEPMPDAFGRYLPSPSGRDLVLHLNLPLQYKVEQRLEEALSEYGAESGTIIVMEPRTGAVLALANWPPFDPNLYTEVPPEVLNDLSGRTYEPGSVFKVITYAAGLDSGFITPDDPLYDDGQLEIGGRTIRNAQDMVYGDVTVREALAKSINVVTARMCLALGPATFYRYVRQFGFGKLTEVDLFYEDRGIVKRWDGGNWSTYDQAANSFGQGISVTALQIANAVAAIANQGRLMQPQVAAALVRDGQLYPIRPRMMAQAIKPETAHTLTQMMVYTVDSSSYADLIPGYRIAGKTGTAEIPTAEGYTSDETIVSFAGFLPAADPQLVIMVKIVKPQSSPWAEKVAVPVFQKIAQDGIRILRIAPDGRLP